MMQAQRVVAPAVLAILGGLVLFGVLAQHLAILNLPAQAMTLTEAVEQVALGQDVTASYQPLLAFWKPIIGETMQARRLLSLLLLALCFACIYRLAVEVDAHPSATWVVICAALTLASFATHFWAWIHSWLSLLIMVSTLAGWWLIQSPHHRLFNGVIYLIAMALLIASDGQLIALLIVHLAYKIFATQTRRSQLMLIMLIVVVVSASNILRSILSNLPPLLTAFAKNIQFRLPPLMIALGIWACIALLAQLYMHRIDRSGAWRTPLILIIWLIVPLIVVVPSAESVFVMGAAIVFPIAVGVMGSLHLVSTRVRLTLAILAFTLIWPYQAFPLDHDLLNWYSQGTPIVVGVEAANADNIEMIDRLFVQSRRPFYYVLRNGQTLELKSPNQINLIEMPSVWRLPHPGVWLFQYPNQQSSMPVPLNISGYELIFQKTYKGLQASFYYTRPTREVIYRFGPLTLLDFEVQSDSTIAPGETLWLTSWWSLDQPLQDNYWLSAALIDPMGRPQAGADGMLGDSFTGMWKARSLHMDRRKIRLPVTIPSGNYNLVLVMHGTVRDTANLLITLADDSPVGRYGYLTTITVP